MGLTPKEYNEFIVYWLPQMQKNKYNYITFQNEAYTGSAVLNINPKSDSMLRVSWHISLWINLLMSMNKSSTLLCEKASPLSNGAERA